MKKLLLTLASVSLIVSLSFADTYNLKSGWNLVGSSSSVNLNDFNNSNIKVIWRWHNGEWQAFTTDNDIKSLLNENNITFFDKTDPNEGFWVYALSDITIDIVNDFYVMTGSAISSVDEFLNNLGFTPVSITNDNLAGKMIVTDGGNILYLNEGGIYKEYKDNGEKIEGNWSVIDSVMIFDNKVYVAIQQQYGSFILIKGYNTKEGDWFTDNAMLLNQATKITSSNEFLALFDSNTPIDTLTDISGQTWHTNPETDEVITFYSDKTFKDTWLEDGKTYTETGTWSIENNVAILTYDKLDNIGIKKAYVVFVNGRAVYLVVDENGNVVNGGVLGN